MRGLSPNGWGTIGIGVFHQEATDTFTTNCGNKRHRCFSPKEVTDIFTTQTHHT